MSHQAKLIDGSWFVVDMFKDGTRRTVCQCGSFPHNKVEAERIAALLNVYSGLPTPTVSVPRHEEQYTE